MPDFLFEIGLEEIPARMIAAAQAELARRVQDILTRERLIPAESGHEIHSYSTPRRLAVLVKSVQAAQADTEEQLTGPSWSIAFKNGEPTPAAHAFAKKAGIEISALEKTTTPKGEYVSAKVHRKGRTASEILTEQLPKELSALYWPKNMYWRAGKPERFVRPVKWLVALLDHTIVPVEFAGVHAANITYGHRILHGAESVTIEHAADYLGLLEAAHVTADVELRRHRIRKALDAVTRAVPGTHWREDHALVDTVTHLTEWPSVILGSFEPEYLTLPEEVLVTVMRDHQKYFAVEDADHKLVPYFLAVLNTQPEERADEIIRHGNERVLRARFNDARFFWDVDQKIPLTERVEMLKSVTFQKDLGSYYAKTEANLRIAEHLANIVSERGTAVNKAALLTATKLAKTDLTAELVKEFTELQGIVGGLYARAQGLGETVAQAIYWQYSPAGMEDPIPPTAEGQILGIADRLSSIVSLYEIGLKPTGSRDPFGLRRAANGIIKILAESDLEIEFKDLLEGTIPEIAHIQTIYTKRIEITLELTQLLTDRLAFYLDQVKGLEIGVIRAVLPGDPETGFTHTRILSTATDAIARAEALTRVRGSEDLAAISSSFKRIKNILRQAEEKQELTRLALENPMVSTSSFTDTAEHVLFLETQKLVPVVEALRIKHQYREALEQIATLRPHVDLFFDKVMVMAEDPAVRQNRLALIATVLDSFSSIADFSEIVTS